MPVQSLYFGAERQPLLLVDDFLPQPQQWLDAALQQQNVMPASGLYPGLRAAAPRAIGERLLSRYEAEISTLFNCPIRDLQQIDSFYSLVCTPATELSILQSLPHVDRPDPAQLAAVLYLCDTKHGGTSFYRHRSTGYEMLTSQRLPDYQRSLEADLQRHGQPRGYIGGDTLLFERILQVPVRFNRLILYRCSSLHSGDIPNQQAFDLNPRTGRFTATLFFSAQP